MNINKNLLVTLLCCAATHIYGADARTNPIELFCEKVEEIDKLGTSLTNKRAIALEEEKKEIEQFFELMNGLEDLFIKAKKEHTQNSFNINQSIRLFMLPSINKEKKDSNDPFFAEHEQYLKNYSKDHKNLTKAINLLQENNIIPDENFLLPNIEVPSVADVKSWC